MSSTYTDLVEERKEVVQAILECDCFPAGMELFPASNDTQLKIIQKVIDESDFYLLIIAGKYGSTRKYGKKLVSYTEKEYDYAVAKGKPVIVLLHNDISNIPAKNVEATQTARKRLNSFRKKASKNRLVAFWSNKDELKARASQAIVAAQENNQVTGWVRADQVNQAFDNEKRNKDISDIDKISFPHYFKSVKKNIDVVHIHGLSWTDRHREYLQECLEREKSVEVRVFLLSKSSTFLEPYAKFINHSTYINQGIDVLREKHDNSIEMWKEIYQKSSLNGARGAAITIYDVDAFPAKSLYRFDDTIIAIPNANSNPKTIYLPSITCSKKTNSAVFESYEKELNWLQKNGTIVCELKNGEIK